MSKEQVKDMCASIIAKLQGSGVANSVVLSVVESMLMKFMQVLKDTC